MIDMAGFPQYALRPDHVLWRIHSTAWGPWHFRTDGRFRFDLVGNTEHGTCYFSDAALGAFVEAFQSFRGAKLSRAEIDARRLFSVTFGATLTLADTTVGAGAHFGLDGAIGASSSGDYARSQEFARDAYEAGFSGVRYRVRNDLEQMLYGIALFGPLTSRSTGTLPSGTSDRVSEEVIADACQSHGFRVSGPLLDPLMSVP